MEIIHQMEKDRWREDRWRDDRGKREMERGEDRGKGQMERGEDRGKGQMERGRMVLERWTVGTMDMMDDYWKEV